MSSMRSPAWQPANHEDETPLAPTYEVVLIYLSFGLFGCFPVVRGILELLRITFHPPVGLSRYTKRWRSAVILTVFVSW